MQFQADLLGLPVEVAPEREMTAIGAAALAAGHPPSRAPGAVYEPRMSRDQADALYRDWLAAVQRARTLQTPSITGSPVASGSVSGAISLGMKSSVATSPISGHAGAGQERHVEPVHECVGEERRIVPVARQVAVHARERDRRRIATPSAPPICWDVLIRPDAMPASSCAARPTSAAIGTGTKEKPRPTPARMKPGTRSTCVASRRRSSA